MSKVKLGGYACPICNTANIVSNTYCSHCGHWLLDTEREAKPLSKKEFKRLAHKPGNAFYRLGFMQLLFGLVMIYDILIKSQVGIDWAIIIYLLFTAIINLKAGKLTEKQRAENQ